MLWHVSEESGIERFEPRPSSYTSDPVVWAVHDSRLHNYLLPRECPRVTFYAGAATTAEDVATFLECSPAVVAFESAWVDRVRGTRLFSYQLAESGFECIDECAGHFVNRNTATPITVQVIEDPLAAIASRGVEIRIVPSLWALHDAVLKSSVKYSIIRMRNAQPRGPNCRAAVP